MGNPSLEQILVDWLLDTFGICAEYQTKYRTITWRDYTLIAFPYGTCSTAAMFPNVRSKDAAICWSPQIYNLSNPDVFTKLKEEMDICVSYVRKQTDYLYPMAMAKWA